MLAHTNGTHYLSPVMPALVAGIHVLKVFANSKTWMAGTRRPKARRPFGRLCPAMTNETHCLSPVMPALVAGIHDLKAVKSKDVDGRNIGVRKHAVLSDGYVRP